jgi:hypothetical protein
MTQKIVRPDSDFNRRLVGNMYGVTWHTLECKTGKLAKRSFRTVHVDPAIRRKALDEKNGYASYQKDRLAKCCLGKTTQESKPSPKFTTTQAHRLFANARSAGFAAGNAFSPTPMLVGSSTTFLGTDIDPTKRTYIVPDGVCGFAWVLINPANSSIAIHAKKQGIGSKAYGGGLSIWIHDHNQSMERKMAHADAFAGVLRDAGIEAYAQSRMD